MRAGLRFLILALPWLLPACDKAQEDRLLGYVEGDYIYMALPDSGHLASISVARGDRVESGAPLFTLDDIAERARLAKAEADLAEAERTLADLKLGERPEELAVIQAQLDSAQASLMLSEPRVKRRRELVKNNIVGAEDLDAAEASILEDRGRIAEYTARLAAAELPARGDRIAAQQAAIDAFRAAIQEAQWSLDERRAIAPAAASIEDVYYRLGEEVAAEKPVLQMLPPENIKLRLYVPEPDLGKFATGQRLDIQCDGCPQGLTATINFISAKAEYTPPVIYSETSRTKLVFLIEARPDITPANFQWHPGQPVEARLQPATGS